MSDTHAALRRRLFASVRRERPSAELRERVLALGRAERAQVRSGLVRRAPVPRVAYSTIKRGVGRSRGLAACAALSFAALVFAIAWAFDDRPGIVISAEQSEAHASRAKLPPVSPEQPEVSAPPEAPARPSSVAIGGSKRAHEASRRTKPMNGVTTEKIDAGRSLPERRSTLAEQLEQIKTARAALRAGDPARALSLLDAYQARSRGGELGAEATLLRIEALAASARRGEAAELARKFAVDYPNSPLIDRVLAFTGE
jgi:hypothetical protein